MALVVADRVRETTTTTGQGTVTLAGAVTGFQSFSVVGNANTTFYCIAGQGTSEWEVGIGTYTSSGTTLSRDTVLASSAGAPTKTTFSAGTKDVFITYPASESVTVNGPAIPGTIQETIFPLTDSASISIDPANGSIQTLTLLGIGRALTYGSMLDGQAVTLMVNDGSAGTITAWNVTWVNNSGNPPTLSLSAYTVVVVWKVGGVVYGALVGNA